MAVISVLEAGGLAVTRFLDLIAISEVTCTSPLTVNDGYDVIVTGIAGPDPATDKHGPEVFADYSQHPFEHRRPKLFRLPDVPDHRSTAAGRYQILHHIFDTYRDRMKLPDFSPLSQDRVALQQMKERHAITLIQAGHIGTAIEACANIWASFPGNNYGQGGHSMQSLLAKYQALAVPDSVPVPNSSYAA